jgi:hypothetical protein
MCLFCLAVLAFGCFPVRSSLCMAKAIESLFALHFLKIACTSSSQIFSYVGVSPLEGKLARALSADVLRDMVRQKLY